MNFSSRLCSGCAVSGWGTNPALDENSTKNVRTLREIKEYKKEYYLNLFGPTNCFVRRELEILTYPYPDVYINNITDNAAIKISEAICTVFKENARNETL